MAEVLYHDERTFMVTLTTPEVDILHRYSSQRGVVDALGMQTLVSFALSQAATIMEQEESGCRLGVTVDEQQADVVVTWPKNGMMSVITDNEKVFVKSVLDAALNMALHTIIHHKIAKETMHELEG